jgi:hypothetical protein
MQIGLAHPKATAQAIMRIPGWRRWKRCPECGKRPRFRLLAWHKIGDKPCSSMECSLDPLTSPVVMGWMKGSLRPPKHEVDVNKVAGE